MSRHDKSFVVHLLEPAIKRCLKSDVKLVAIVALSDFTKDYLIKQKIIPNNI